MMVCGKNYFVVFSADIFCNFFTAIFSDYTNDKVNLAGPGVYKAMLLLSLAFILKLVTTIFTFGIKV